MTPVVHARPLPSSCAAKLSLSSLLACAMSVAAFSHAPENPNGSPFGRAGLPWPASTAPQLNFRQVLAELGGSEHSTSGQGIEFPLFWAGQVDQLLPGQEGWLG